MRRSCDGIFLIVTAHCYNNPHIDNRIRHTMLRVLRVFRVYGVLTPLSTVFQLDRGGGQFYWWRKLEYPEKTYDLSKIIDKLLVSSTPCHEWGSNSQL